MVYRQHLQHHYLLGNLAVRKKTYCIALISGRQEYNSVIAERGNFEVESTS